MRISPRTLERYRVTGEGPIFLKARPAGTISPSRTSTLGSPSESAVRPRTPARRRSRRAGRPNPAGRSVAIRAGPSAAERRHRRHRECASVPSLTARDRHPTRRCEALRPSCGPAVCGVLAGKGVHALCRALLRRTQAGAESRELDHAREPAGGHSPRPCSTVRFRRRTDQLPDHGAVATLLPISRGGRAIRRYAQLT